MGALTDIFRAGDLTPHGFCLLWRPELLGLHIFSDTVIGLSYYAIPVALGYFVWKRKDIVFGFLFWLFAAFILACGTTHWFEIWTIWHPDYGAEGAVKLATAAISLASAVALWSQMPRALALPTLSQYRAVSAALTSEVEQRRSVSRALAEAEQRVQLLVSGITEVAIFSLDPNGVIRDWNQGAERIKGYTAEEAIGAHFSIFYPASERDQGTPGLTLETAARDGRYEAEALRVRRDGSQFWANVIIEPIRDADGGLAGFVKITRDVSRRHEVEERFRQAQKMEAVGQLTGGVAHDFNNHLTVILASLDRARRVAADNSALDHALAAAVSGAERASTLTAQLLAFARRQPLNPTPLDISQLLAQTSGLLERVLGEQIRIETIRGAGVWPAYCDRAQLESALLNVALNARDAMPEGGRLTLEVSNAFLDDDYAALNPGVTPGPYVMIAITDTGQGMTPEVRERAFEPFFTTKSEGTGLGLSQVFGFLKQSGGHVQLYSEPGQGTTIKLYVPRSSHSARPAALHEFEEIPAASGETILVVEDDDDVRSAAAEMVAELGYTVYAASGPVEALHILRERAIALVFTDVVMPGEMSSRQLAERAGELQPGIKVLFTSGYTQNSVVHNGQLDTGVELITKPYRRDQLARRLRRLLEAPRRG